MKASRWEEGAEMLIPIRGEPTCAHDRYASYSMAADSQQATTEWSRALTGMPEPRQQGSN